MPRKTNSDEPAPDLSMEIRPRISEGFGIDPKTRPPNVKLRINPGRTHDNPLKSPDVYEPRDPADPRSLKRGGKVRKTGVAKVHKGERVLTARQARKPAVKRAVKAPARSAPRSRKR